MRDPDPRMDDAARRRLARLVDAIEVGPAPTLDELTRRADARTGAGAGDDLRPYAVSTNGQHDAHGRTWPGPQEGPEQTGRHELSPLRRRRRPKPAVLVGVAAVIAVVVGGLVVWAGSDSGPDGRGRKDSVQTDVADEHTSDGGQAPDEEGAGEGQVPEDSSPFRTPPRWIFDPTVHGQLEPGHTMSVAALPDSDNGQGSVTLYGTAGADQPFAPGDLVVAVNTEDEVFDAEGRPVTVRGRDGRTGTQREMGFPYMVASAESPLAWLQWDEGAAVTVTLLSRSLSEETLAAVAEGLVVEGTDIRPGAVPDGVGTTDIGRILRARFDSDLFAGAGPAYGVSYDHDPQAEGIFNGSVLAYSGGPEQLVMVRWLIGAVDPVEVRGHQGWTTRVDYEMVASSQMLVWAESDDIIGWLELQGLTEAETVAVADDLVEATDEQWDAIPTEADVTNGD
jgi:hypothetical protein